MSSILKGKQNERRLARELREVFPNAARSYEERSGNTGDLTGTPGFCIELKAGKRPSIYAAYEQAAEAAEDDETPVGVVFWDRSKRSDPRNGRRAFRGVMLGLDDFVELLKRAETPRTPEGG